MKLIVVKIFLLGICAILLSNRPLVISFISQDDIKKKNIIISDTIRNSKIDSLKWLAYSMNFYMSASHFKENGLPNRSILECDVYFDKEDYSRKDTVIYYFNFYFQDIKNVYTPNSFYFNGIGYSYLNKNYFPWLSHAYPIFAKNVDTCKFFFETRERDFSSFLKQYNGNISSWLREEASKKNIIKD